MKRPHYFRYPRSGLLLARLLTAMGFGTSSWPGQLVSQTTFKRIVADDQPTFVLRDFIDEALGLLGSSSGRWEFGPVPLTRSQVFELIVEALRAYDRAVSELNGSSSLLGADRRHALPILTLLAVRLGTFVGLAAAIRGEPLDAFWKRTPLDPAAFCLAVTRYAEQAMPTATWRERGEESPIGKNALARWRSTPPGENFKFASLKKFSRWVAKPCGGDPAAIEWHLRWLAAGARLYEALDRYLGRDTHGEPWIDRLRLTAEHHARINFELYTNRVGLPDAVQYLAPEMRKGLSSDEDLKLRRLFAWVVGRSNVIDLNDGPALSEDELALVHARVGDDEAARQVFWTRLGFMHALGLPAPGYMEAIERHFGCLDQYIVQHKHPAQYLKLQHDMVAAHLENPDQVIDPTFVDDHIASTVKMVFLEERAEPFLRHVHSRFATLFTDHATLGLGLAAAQQLLALQRELAGVSSAIPPVSIAAGNADPQIGGLFKLLVLHRILPKLAEKGDVDAIVRELEEALRQYPDMVEPAQWLTRLGGEQLIEMENQLLVAVTQVQTLLGPEVGPTGPTAYAWYRKLIIHRQRLRKLQRTVGEHLDTAISALEETAERAHERWSIDLDTHVLAGRRAAIAHEWHRRFPRTRQWITRDASVESLSEAVAALRALHGARPEHPEPCLWLARFYAQLGDRAEARHWARLAEQRGDSAGLQALDG